jgi:hypothetical protein
METGHFKIIFTATSVSALNSVLNAKCLRKEIYETMAKSKTTYLHSGVDKVHGGGGVNKEAKSPFSGNF